MKRNFLCLLLFLISYSVVYTQDTTIIQTLTYDSSGRDYVFSFPADDGTSYEKILMEYNMRCKGALVSTGSNTNLGCGEWDYSCNTYVVDSSYVDSLKTYHPSHIISGFSGDQFNYKEEPTYSYNQYVQQEVSYDNVISENSFALTAGSEEQNHPFSSSGTASKTQYLWTADELNTAGLTTGAISSIKLNLSSADTEAQFLKIKMKHTPLSELSETAVELEGFTEVYFLNTQLVLGENEFRFYHDFDWDGLSNILMELSFSNNSLIENQVIGGETLNTNMALLSNQENFNLEMTGSEYLELPTNGFDEISNELSIAFWSFGAEDVLPAATTTFEGVDDQNRRQANVHLPWSNSQVYWDCGNDGEYDRIHKLADPNEFKGKWNHWAFTKNSISGEMKIYLNGQLWHSDTGKTKPIQINKFTLGKSNGNGPFYYGNIDEFQIWDVELTESQIADWMFRMIDDTHPNYSNLISYYQLNEGSGTVAQNMSTYGGSASIEGQANWKKSKGEDLYTQFVGSNQRPNITFTQGEYNQTIEEVIVIDTVLNNQHAVFTYQVVGGDLEISSIDYVWQAGYEYLYNSAGEAIDSFEIIPSGLIEIGELIYHRKFPYEFEIMSFVTPYGINLDLGENGKTWIFDVTDFAPILKGNKRMLMKLGGEYQEEMDIRFLFIEGTPPREVKNIQQIWKSGIGHTFQSIINDDVLEARNINLDPDGAYFKIRTMVTGHGQEGEFIPRTHLLNLNGGNPEFTWDVWKSCGNNPVFPQGGTWIYDRAGWCPGAPTDLVEWDITDMVSPGESVNVDYSVTTASGDSRYLISHQLVTYGPANYTVDAAIPEIIRPSLLVEYDRINPICNEPIIVLQNTGSATMTSALITYYVEGGTPETYQWTGSLDFLESEEVVLPVTSNSFWAGNPENIFIATVSNPNGGNDEYPNNSSASSPFILPDIYEQEAFIIALNTNAYGSQNSYSLKDINGNVLVSRNNLSNQTYYRDTVFLEDGCYTLELEDTGGNGLDFWAQPSQGSGGFYLRTYNQTLKVFEPDFGSSIKYSFVKGQITNVEPLEFQYSFDIFPNPNSGVFNVVLDLPDSQDTRILLFDMKGNLIESREISSNPSEPVSLDLSNQPDGIYNCTIINDQITKTKKILKASRF